MKLNEVIYGFRLLKETEVPEISSKGYEFLHEKSGARLFFVENDDDNKVFSISFRTPPKDDTGVPHIVEHSTLCGSRKYPLKEPFVELVKGSLNTFLNAMTYPDKTMYPVASRNDKDFQNLMDVYLDAVFYPAMYEKKEVLMQEGWHYEIESPEEPLRYSGVVFNEMKGATSSPEDLLDTEIFKGLMPDTPYAFESGGNPEKIPDLTQEKFIAFHKKYYHPSNSYIFFYGDLDIEEKLKYLDEEYLSHFSRIDVDSEIPKQKPFDGVKRVVKEYPVGAEEDTKEKTFLKWNAVICDAEDYLTKSGLSVLTHALFETDAAPLRQAFIAAGIGKDVAASFETQLRQSILTVEITNAEEKDTERFYEILQTKLKELADNGIDRTLLEASLNYIEFKVREEDSGRIPKGLVYNIAVMGQWLYGADPARALFYEESLKKMREGLDNGFFEDLIRRCLIDNPHQLLVTLRPSTTMAKEREEHTAQLLAARKAAMTKEEIQDIIDTTAHLKEFQQTPDTAEQLAMIPLLKLSDIRKDAEELPLEEKDVCGVKVLYSDVDTHGIAYLGLYTNIDAISEELQPYAYFLVSVLGGVDTKEHNYTELTNLENLCSGGIAYNLTSFSTKRNEEGWDAKGTVKMRALVRKLPEAAKLLKEILTGSVFTDKTRLKELVAQSLASAERGILNTPNQLMAQELASHITKAGAFDEKGGLPYYWFLKDLSEHFDERFDELSKKLTELLPMFCSRRGLTVSLTVSGKDYESAVTALKPLLEGLSDKEFPKARREIIPEKANEGFMTSSRVQYVGKGGDYSKHGYEFTGSMRVLESIMRYGYLWTKLRVQGGAYGASAVFYRDGLMMFTSYRDPNLTETLDVYDTIADYIRSFTASDREMTKYIIGTISTVDMPMTPRMKGDTAAQLWLRGVTYDDRQKARDEILSTGIIDIQKLAGLVEACMKDNNYCVFGNEEKLTEHKDCFTKLVRVME